MRRKDEREQMHFENERQTLTSSYFQKTQAAALSQLKRNMKKMIIYHWTSSQIFCTFYEMRVPGTVGSFIKFLTSHKGH